MKALQAYDNWRDILRKAWSIRFIILAGILSAVEIILPLFIQDLPRGVFATLSFLATTGAFVSRLVVQRNLDEPKA